MLPLILASSSPYRRELLTRLGLNFDCVSPDIDESPRPEEGPEQLVERLSISKANKVASKLNQHLIIASDQVACLDGKILSKPGNHQTALSQLSDCSGRSVTFHTGLTVLNSATSNAQTHVELFTVHFRNLDQQRINDYLQREQPYDCAGSFKVEGLGIALFKRLEGDDPNSLIGLPLIKLISLLEKEGVDVLAKPPLTDE